MVLTATAGDPLANSYLSVAEADAIADEQGLGREPQLWIKAPFADKERALIRATSELDAFLGVSATAWSDAQPLLFPRAVDVGPLSAPFIVNNVRLATFHQALYVLLNAQQISDSDSRRARGLVSFSDDDGSGSLGEPQMISVQARWFLRALKGSGRSSLVSVPMASSYSDPLVHSELIP